MVKARYEGSQFVSNLLLLETLCPSEREAIASIMEASATVATIPPSLPGEHTNNRETVIRAQKHWHESETVM